MKFYEVKLKYIAHLNPSKSEIDLGENKEKVVSFLPMDKIISPNNLDLSLNKTIEEVYSGYTYFRENDIVLAKVTPCFENGNLAIARGLTNEIGFGTTELHVLRVNEKFYDTEYIYYCLQLEDFKSKAVANMYGVGGLKRIPTEFLSEYKFLVPDLDTQIRIRKYLNLKLSEISNLIGNKTKLIKLLEQQRQSIITEAVTKGLNPNVKMKDSGVEWIGEIPEHWEIKKIKNIANVYSSNVDKKSVEGEKEVLLCNYVDVYYNDSITADINFMKATAKDEQIKTFTLKKHDVIITKDSESPKDIAIPTWVSQDLDGVVCGYHLSLIRCFENTLGHYLYYTLESNQIKEQFYTKANGVTRFGLSKEAIKNGLIAIPPFNEQLEIAEMLNNVNQEVRSTVEKLKIQIEKLKEYRQSLIYEAVTGKIDVREMELDEVR
ncbi:restriction endonuclease subunit S [Bacillus halotolerans]|uniref:restriction endonuclease subunit S n=1 Tax=Bacillus halotolerans TaxID=260554 RepID=UPI000D01439C|nr:restriction endonuclease subunit S [Bacillus halotolerans]MCP9300748.1 restriction endonuclease subunit S [Bacillus halotolerans]MDP4526441.1 restriction endonuclease subunit S [Bacillus halotolerans]PRP50406.1 restriction endonuclease subunit S [Bacillus halotolerans]PRP58812.1 restriction endonuclease subunit S [Bacillus halotolerans]PRP62678.1 restriction endonuclease subunit S [Bacillus halotolerans]